MSDPAPAFETATDYAYRSADSSHHHAWLLPAIDRVLRDHPGRRIMDVGCGNGSVAAHLARLGYAVTGIDPSETGIEIGRRAHPEIDLHQASAYDDLAGRFGRFPIVMSLDVVEHLYAPRTFASRLYDLVEPGGIALVSTPYHGYWKNLALAVTGKLDAHWSPLWDHGHIKFWSVATLTQLLNEAGFRGVEIRRIGRIPPLAASMLAIARVAA